jgi:hypothetical protein
MLNDCVINNVRIFRPFLNNTKNDIYTFAHNNFIPYTKNTTPIWSCRGVLRNKIVPELKNQFGNGVLNNLIHIGSSSNEWNNIINKCILQPIFNTIEYKTNGCKIHITDNYKDFTKVIWMKLFIFVFHKLGFNMITKKSLDNFINNFNNYLKKDTKIVFSNKCICIICNNYMYIYSCKFDINIFNISITDIEFNKQNEINNAITYDDLLNGSYCYTEYYNDNMKIQLINNFNKKDSTKKIFSKIFLLKDSIPKLSSTYDFIPTKLAKIIVSWK